jgi:hypothetical protein
MIWDMPIGWAMKLIRKAIEQRAEERAWQLYCSAYPHFSKKNFKTFEQFYPKKKKPKATKPITQADMERFADIADLLKHRERK